MLLSLFLLMFAQTGTPAPADVRADLAAAIELADHGKDAAALAALQAIAARDPGDRVARLWIARVLDRMGHPDLAEPVYRSIALEDPRNVDALVGVGVTLLEQDRVTAALDTLERAEELAAQDPAVLGALGDAHARAGHTARALGYLQRVATASPTAGHRLALEQARRAHGNRFESQTYDERFDAATPETRGSDIGVNVRLSDQLRVVGRGQVQRTLGRTEHRAGGGAQWRVTPDATISGQALVGDGHARLPRVDYLGQVEYGSRRATWTGAVRYFDFNATTVTMVSPEVTVAVRPGWTAGFRYAMTMTTTAPAPGTSGHTAQVRASHLIRPRVWLHGLYTRGIDTFDNFTIDRLGALHANTATASVQVLLPSVTSIVGAYDYQARQGGVTLKRFSISLVQSF